LTKVAIYEDNHGLRDIISQAIRSQDLMEVAGEFSHCLDVVKNTELWSPDVVIMDIDMPGMTGIEGVKNLKNAFPHVEVIMHTVFDDDDRIFMAIRNGATGYILKNQSIADMLNAITDVRNGGAPMSPRIARKIIHFQTQSSKNIIENLGLTDREYEILHQMSKGLSYKMVAEELFISIDTVRTHVKRIYEKLHVHSVTEAVHKVFIDKKNS
jgi:DNA-binding NarL/FixJ family response regulator